MMNQTFLKWVTVPIIHCPCDLSLQAWRTFDEA